MKSNRERSKMKFNSIKIFTFLEENKLSRTEFCKRCGIGIDTLNKLLSGNMKVRVKAIIKIVNYTNIIADDFFVEDGYNTLHSAL